MSTVVEKKKSLHGSIPICAFSHRFLLHPELNIHELCRYHNYPVIEYHMMEDTVTSIYVFHYFGGMTEEISMHEALIIVIQYMRL